MPSRAQRAALTTKRRKTFIAALADGMSVTSAATVAGLARRYVYDIKEANPEFAAEWDDAVQQATDKLEDEVRSRAMGAMDAIVYRGEVTGQVKRHSDILMMFLLKARRPEFKDNAKIEVATSDRLDDLIGALSGQPRAADSDPEEAPVPDKG